MHAYRLDYCTTARCASSQFRNSPVIGKWGGGPGGLEGCRARERIVRLLSYVHGQTRILKKADDDPSQEKDPAKLKGEMNDR